VRKIGGQTTRLSRPVVVSVKTSAECRADPDLAAFRVADGPSAPECEAIQRRLLLGEAHEQTVVMLREEGSRQILSIISIRFDGRDEWQRPFAQLPAFVRRLVHKPYVNLLARDSRFLRCLLADGRTGLGAATLRAGLELATAPNGESPLPLWAVIEPSNERAHRAFAAAHFRVHPGSAQLEGDVVIRRRDLAIGPALAPRAYRPLGALPIGPFGRYGYQAEAASSPSSTSP
jgi:hypothetical protein